MADLLHLGRVDGRRRTAAFLERFDLTEAARKRVATYSVEMKRKLDPAMGLVGAVRITSLGFRTDVMLLTLQGCDVEDRGDHLVIASRALHSTFSQS